MEELEDPPRKGQILVGKYRIDGILGRGGMGYVLGAYHLELCEPVAIKWVREEELGNRDAIDRFLREARLCAKIRSEHVVRVRDVARTETGRPFIVMERLDGTDLATLIEGDRALPIGTACDYLVEACEAIAEAHELGIVHRDLKPKNLFLARRADGTDLVKVLDFGISKLLNSATLAQTVGAQILGSPLYMSPEQWRSARDVDARTDIWSLGVVLFELLTGQIPFDGDSIPTLCMKITNTEPHPPSKLVPEIPAALDAIVLACLEKDPSHRPENVGALVRALEPFATPRTLTSSQRILRLQPSGEIPPSSPRLGSDRAVTIADTVAIHSRTLGSGTPRPGNTGPVASSSQLRPLRWARALPLLGVAAVVTALGVTRLVSPAHPVAEAATSPSLTVMTLPPPSTRAASTAPTPAPSASAAGPPAPPATLLVGSSRPRPPPRVGPAASVTAVPPPASAPPPANVAPAATVHVLGESRR